MDALKSLLPPGDGYLPYYILVVSLLAVGNSVQNYVTLHYTRRMYSGLFVPNPSAAARAAKPGRSPEDSVSKLVPAPAPADGTATKAKDGRAQDQVTPLAARLNGTYTVISAIVRLYAAYHLRLGPVYRMALWTYVVALAHYASELLVYRTARPGAPVLMPFLFASLGISWMFAQYDFYVEVEA